MQDNGVTFKGTVNCLTIIMKDTYDFDEIFNQVNQKIASAGKFFKGASIDVRYKGRDLSADEERKILKLLSEKSGAEIRSIEREKEEPDIPKIINDTISSSAKPKSKSTKKYLYFSGIDEGSTKFYKGTVRSGQLVKFDGNVVVIGDVNPGGEIVALGNVVVMGSLRGIVHAGADGNKEATVVAFNLYPTQLRIADVITRSPDGKNAKNQNIPEMAYIKDDMVYIERFLAQR